MSKGSDVLNRYRVFPRLFAILYGYLLYIASFWFMDLETPGVEQAGFVSTMIATSAAFFKYYLQERKGNAPKIDE